MSTLPAKTIVKNDPRFADTPGFQELRRRGLEHIAALSGGLWTDHNLHDPGITLLEVLCYALTDLGYRTSLDEAELFAPSERGETDGSFFTPAEILTNNPVTLLDYRRMLVDIPGVRNAWVEKVEGQEVPLYYVKPNKEDCAPRALHIGQIETGDEDHAKLELEGLYRVLLDVDPLLTAGGDEDCRVAGNTLGETLEEVNRRLYAHRNLCEDFTEVMVLGDEQIRFCLDLDLAPKADPDVVLAGVFDAIEDFLSPRVRFASLKELLAEGKPLEEIYRGRPYLPAYEAAYGVDARSHGFIDVDQLREMPRRTILQASDFYRVIMDVPGVRAIRELRIANYINGRRQAEDAWKLTLTPGHRPLFDAAGGVYKFNKGELRVPSRPEAVIARFQQRLADYRKTPFNHSALDRAVPYGRHRDDLGEYYSVQHELPAVYALGEGELEVNATPARKAQVRQLRAFLLFFDQLLANYCSQLFNTRRLYSWHPGAGKTSFSQPIVGAPGAADLLRFKSSEVAEKVETSADIIVRGMIGYDHPLDRDQAIEALQNELNALTLAELRARIVVKKTTGGRYFFQVNDGCERGMLRGHRDYRLENTAKEMGETAALSLLAKGVAKNNYQREDYPAEHRYTFCLIDGPVKEDAFLDAISEDKTTYATRRNAVLDQLLARFNEQFTDYVLLTYALKKAAPDPLKVIEDKERFLAAYPTISRRRGTGFDYRVSGRSGNVSGLERRVGGLIGLSEEQAPPRSPFSVHLRRQENHLVWKDHRGRVMLRSVATFEPGTDLSAARAELLTQLLDPDAYQPQNCAEDSVYRYTLTDAEGLPLAVFPATFADAESRNESIKCTLAYFKGKENRNGRKPGIQLGFHAEKQGFFFALTSAEGETINLRTAAVYPTVEEAWPAGLALLAAARAEENYRPTTAAGRFGFDLTDAGGEWLGEHPITYATEAERDAAMTEVMAFYAKRRIDHRFSRTPERYFWRVCVGDDGPELRSLLPFAEADSARRNWLVTVAKMKEGLRLHVRRRSAEEFRVELRRPGGLVLAESNAFPDKQAAEAAREALRVYLAAKKERSVNIVADAGEWWFEVLMDEKVMLRGERRYADKAELEREFLLFTKLATDEDNYRELPDPDGCLVSFGVKDDMGMAARYPGFLPEEEANDLRKRLLRHFVENAIDCAIGHQDFRWTYQLGWVDCKGRCADLLLSEGAGWPTEAEARKAANALLTKLGRTNPLEDRKNGELFTFGVSSSGISLATHPVDYPTEAAREKVKTDVLLYLARFKELCEPKAHGFTTEPTLFVHCKSLPACCEEEKKRPTSDCVLSGFRLRKDGASVAVHPGRPETAETRDEMVTAIQAALRSGALMRYEYFGAGPQVQGEALEQGYPPVRQCPAGGWTFHLYDPATGQEWLRSTARYPDRNGAGRAYNLLLELLANPNNYRPDDHPEAGIFRLLIVETLLEGSITYANQLPEEPERLDPSEISETTIIPKVHRPVICPAEYEAVTYPVFAFYEDKTHEEDMGEEVFLSVRPNLCPKFNPEKTIRPLAWDEGLRTFLIHGTSEKNFYDFLDGERDCHFGFRIVKPGYRLARNPRESHTPAERERLLDWLYHESLCPPTPKGHDYQLCYRRGEETWRAVLRAPDGEDHWVATTHLPTPEAVRADWEGAMVDGVLVPGRETELLNLAQEPAFYDARREIDKADVVTYRLILLDEAGRAMMESPDTYPFVEVVGAIHARIRRARRYPLYVYEQGGQKVFGFQCYSEGELPAMDETPHRYCPPTSLAPAAAPEKKKEADLVNEVLELNVCAPGEVIWESTNEYATEAEARSHYNCFLRLLADRRNLQRIQLSNCNLFGLELTRPDYVLAEHPRRYPRACDLREAKDRTLACINGEGLHLVEHLLLRPRATGDMTIPNVCPAPPADVTDTAAFCPGRDRWLPDSSPTDPKPDEPEVAYVPGADPYSYWATVVLPYWPDRFQNMNFRSFFEDSLRREAPAHVALKICWLDPLQMRDFEQKHQRWLDARGDADNCGRSEALNELITFLAKMTSVYPPARLTDGDCAARNVTQAGAVLLDSTQLS